MSDKAGGLRINEVALLVFAVAVYSISGFFSKLASNYSFFSTPYLAYLGGVVIVLGLYAVIWQMALKRVPLNKAYLFKSLSLVFGLCIAHYAFFEEITIQNLSGGFIVLIGL